MILIHSFTWEINRSCATQPYGRKNQKKFLKNSKIVPGSTENTNNNTDLGFYCIKISKKVLETKQNLL